MDLRVFLPPLVACLVIVAIHSYLGIHVIAREVIFVDLSARADGRPRLGGGDPEKDPQPYSTVAFLYALGFTTIGAVLFAMTRTEEGRAKEAIIGIVYVVALGAAVLVANRTPAGARIKDI